MVNKQQFKDLEIEKFLEGHNPLKYLVRVEAGYYSKWADCYFDDPKKGKFIKKIKFKPFLYFKDGLNLNFENSNIESEKQRYGISIKSLQTGQHERLENGFKYMAESSISFQSILDFFKSGGVKVYSDYDKETGENGESDRDSFFILKPEEQFFISTGIRLFKGFELYSEVHKLVFDIETEGLKSENDRIFQIGMMDNRGFEKVLEVEKLNDDDSERKIIKGFFYIIQKLKPAIVYGYNSEDFDFSFILDRMNKLEMNQKELYLTLNSGKSVKVNTTLFKSKTDSDYQKTMWKKKGTVKFGGETHYFNQTMTYGYSPIDTMHAAKKLQAIDSDVKSVKLKYLCKLMDISKPDRMYVEGDKIHKIWRENKWYIINKRSNNYYLLDNQENPEEELNNIKLEYDEEKYQLVLESVEDLELIKGGDIIRRYLLDDLWETEKLDESLNESSFMLSKLIPVNFNRVCTMGNAAMWNLIMATWSYENNLAIPESDNHSNFVGGLARVFKVGYSENILKLDFASLYPSIQLTHNVFPLFDITGVMRRLLTYFKFTREHFKALSGDKTFSNRERKFYKTKQQPIKTLNNSMFGALGSGIAFNWSDGSIAARITCSGRLYLRKLIKYFREYDCIPLLAVTDGVNFSIPLKTKIDIDKNSLSNEIDFNEGIKYKGLSGVKALVEKFNDEEMPKPFMSVDLDGEWKSCLNLSRINYANLEYSGKIKTTGNTIKSKTMPEYIEDFINKGLKLILENKPVEFINYYYSYINDIYYKQIPLKKIASKKKIKETIDEYKNRGKDKNGRDKAKKAHMELLIENNLNYSIGDVIYYVNNGTAKSHGDSKVIKDKKTGEEKMAAVLISEKDLEKNPNMKGEYNVKKYISNFNERVKKILIGFSEEVQINMIIEKPEEKEFFTEEELKLSNYDKDTFEESMILDSEEIEFWNANGFNPYQIFKDFTLPKNHSLNLDQYIEKQKKLNLKLKEKNIYVKTVNENIEDKDYVLMKRNHNYSLWQYINGHYIKLKDFK
ncbi:MAG: DNA polymerase domain-containing protein [bacterium]